MPLWDDLASIMGDISNLKVLAEDHQDILISNRTAGDKQDIRQKRTSRTTKVNR